MVLATKQIGAPCEPAQVAILAGVLPMRCDSGG
jgi:hypothetical protein